MRASRFLTAVCTLALTSLPAGAVRSEEAGCRTIALDPAPRWTFSGAWTEDGRELVVVDVLGGRLLRYGRDGSHLGTVARPGKGELEFDRPYELVRVGREFVLVDDGDRLLRLDRHLEPIWGSGARQRVPVDLGATPPAGPAPEGSAEVDFVRSLVSTGWEVYGLIDTVGDGAPPLALAELRFASPPRAHLLAALPEPEPAADQLYLAPQLLAAAGGSVYALRFGERSHVARVYPRSGRLEAFPEGFRRLPALQAAFSPHETAAFFASLERATMPVALMGRGGRLYLLTRQPRAGGGTRWTLHAIDPERDRLLRAIELPTTSAHVVVVPGGVDWAILEKGPVLEGGYQEIRSAVLVPSAWIEDADGTGIDLPSRCAAGES